MEMKLQIPPFAIDHMEKVLFEELELPKDDPNFEDTSRRWLKYIQEFMQPFDPERCLRTGFPMEKKGDDSHKPMIVQSDIPYEAICAHHLVPVLGKAHIGYVPTDKAVGLSKLTRLVSGISHQMPSLQEDVGDKVVDSIMKYLSAAGAICVINAEHGCMACRGVSRAGIITSTSSVRGVFRDVPQARSEFFQLCVSRRDL